jgi:putative DNA primase/helicase
MRGKRVCVASETKAGMKLNEQVLKSLTGGDTQQGERKGKDLVEFAVTGKCVLLTNDKPSTSTSEALWRRMCLVEFPCLFKDIDKYDKDDKRHRRAIMGFDEKVIQDKKQLGAFFNYFIMGAKEWYEHGLSPPKSVLANITDYQREENVVQQFIDYGCKSEGWTRSSVLHQCYTRWCSENEVSKILNTRGFGKELTRILGKNGKKRKTGGIHYNITPIVH